MATLAAIDSMIIIKVFSIAVRIKATLFYFNHVPKYFAKHIPDL